MKRNGPGIYKIVCNANKKVYVGSSVRLVDRLQHHRWLLRHNRHHNPILQNAFNHYGYSAFSYEIIEHITEDRLIEREQFWIDFYNSTCENGGFNVIPRADRREHSQDTKFRMSLAKIGKKKSPETRERMRIAQNNRSKEWCDAISKAKKGCTFSEEHRKNLSISKKGKIPSATVLKRCICFDTMQTFDSLRDAERHFGIKRGCLSSAMKRGHKCQGKEFAYVNEN